ncbi:hypothetical protein RESH_01548 [Rhodopirellula europaea SH398]|uniref:Uncharacterized protein n=1 Tax=Rhodopirellula europaea SH398 TaxID=1263868 RepID=M5SNN8_9BACT|nr:hypothetical protein RESH_01548 [Rhodopirellula europaea SH398]
MTLHAQGGFVLRADSVVDARPARGFSPAGDCSDVLDRSTSSYGTGEQQAT